MICSHHLNDVLNHVQVVEVKAHNEYQLKLKELELNERVKELTEKAESETAAAKQK